MCNIKSILRSYEEEFIKNRDAVKSAFKFDSSYIHPVCAIMFLNGRKTVDSSALKDNARLLKEKVGAFSSLRGISRPVIISAIAMDSDPEAKLQRLIKAYASLREHFSYGDHLPVAAVVISEECEEKDFDTVSERSREIYELMKREHPLITCNEDVVFSVLLAISGKIPSDAVIEVERCYKKLKERFFSSNAVQSLAHVLALCEGAADDKCEKTIKLFELLKESKMKYGTDQELATLGVLAMLPTDAADIVKHMSEVSDFLSSQKGYGIFGVGKQVRLMHAGMIITSAYLSDKVHTVSDATMTISSQLMITAQNASIVAAQQAAICVAITAQSASSAAASH